MAYLITGGTGFVGSHAAEQLVERGRDVVLYDYAPDSDRIARFEDDVTVAQGDIRRPDKLARVFREHDIDRVIHTAYLLGGISKRDPVAATEVNGLGTTYVYDLAATFDVERVVNASSIAVYGYVDADEDVEVNENSPRNADTVYGSCKVFNEDMGRHYADEHGMTVTSMRFGSVFGAGRESGASKFASDLIEKPVRGDSVSIPGKYREPNWLYVKDAAASLVHAAEHRSDGYDVFNVRTGIESIDSVADIVRDEIPDADIELETELSSEFFSGNWNWVKMNVEKAERELGFTPQYTVESAVLDHIESIRSG